MHPFTVHTATAVPLRRSDVDTDQIIPARFCTNTTRTGYAEVLFADWRSDPGFVLGRPEHRGASILVAGDNFGTGSSREAAVWALLNYGFRALIAPRYGDIFRTNALANGLLTVTLSEQAVQQLWLSIEAQPSTLVAVDLVHRQVRWDGSTQAFPLDDDTRARLLSGLEPIAATLQHEDAIAEYERRRQPTLPTSSQPATSRHASSPPATGTPS